MRRLLLLLLLSCDAQGPRARVVVTSEVVDLDRARWTPDVVTEAKRAGTRLELQLRPGFRGVLRVEAPGGCAVDAAIEGPRTYDAKMPPKLRTPEWLTDVGYDTDVEIEAREGCDEARAITIVWSNAQGNGHRARVHTPSLRELLDAHGAPLPSAGIVPIAPRTQGAVTVDATYEDLGATLHLKTRVAAAARATGMPTVAVGSRLYLFGEGWKAERDPRGRELTVGTAGGFTTILAKVPGRFVLEDPHGGRLAVRFGRYDEMPLDCARAGCHERAGEAIRASPMTHVFERGMHGALGASYDPSCTVACHAVGEPGVDDGGFVDLLGTFGAQLPRAPSREWLEGAARPLRRMSGVGCMSCHGPAAIPEPTERPDILRADVCATCHDAPPRYGHVMFWQGSRMAQADRAPETRVGECARCHTTGGFLDRLGVRKLAQRMPEPTGIACAACHSPHARDTRGALVRVAPVDASLEARELGASSICMPCHGGDVSGGGVASASTARLVFAAPRVHASDKGCLLCHSSPEKGGGGHTFKAQPATCVPCHGSKTPEAADVAARAKVLWAKLQARGAAPTAMPPHAAPRAPAGPLADAARKVALVVEDPAAGAHNAAYSRALLDEAEKAISAVPPR